MIIVPKDQATLSFLQETKVLKDGRKGSISTLIPQEKKNQDGATWFSTRVWRGGDHVTPSGGGGLLLDQREVPNQASPGHPQRGHNHHP